MIVLGITTADWSRMANSQLKTVCSVSVLRLHTSEKDMNRWLRFSSSPIMTTTPIRGIFSSFLRIRIIIRRASMVSRRVKGFVYFIDSRVSNTSKGFDMMVYWVRWRKAFKF